MQTSDPSIIPCGPEAVCFTDAFRTLNPGITEDELQCWLWYHRRIGRSLRGEWEALEKPVDEQAMLDKGLLCYDSESRKSQLVPAVLYYAGNIYRRIAALKEAFERKHLPQAVYERQLVALEKAKPTVLTLSDPVPANRLYITPRSGFAQSITVEELATGERFAAPLNLKQAYMVWLSQLTASDFEARVTGELLIRYYFRNSPMRDMSEKEKFETRKAIYLEAQRLYQRFLNEIVTREDQKRIEHLWNSRFNNFRDVDTAKVPVAFPHNRMFGFGRSTLTIRPAQREGIAYTTAQGSAIIAYDVGVGKTMTAILTMANELAAGRIQRPLIVVPKATYKKWKREIVGDGEMNFQGLLPGIQVNDLYNLGTRHEAAARDADGGTLEMDAGSITMLTYEGFEKLGFLDTTYRKLEGKLEEILEKVDEADKQAGKKARGQASLQQKIQGMFGAAQRDTLFAVEELGFDYLVLDEAHNFKNIFTSVKGEPGADDDAFDIPGISAAKRKKKDEDDEPTRGKSEYQIQGTMSMRGLRAFLLSCYLRHIGGGVQLLSATPFTNSPLEIYSMLALVAYDKLKERGVHNLKAFFDTFVRLEYDTKYTVRQQLEQGQVIKGFNNRIILQSIIFSYINYKTGEDAGLKECADPDLPPGAACRPKKWVLPMLNVNVGGELVPLASEQQISTFLPPSPLQKQIMQEISEYARKKTQLFQFCDLARGTCDDGEEQRFTEAQYLAEWQGDDKGRYLRAIAFQQNATLSPYLYNCRNIRRTDVDWRDYVESSPKLKYVMGCIASVKRHHEAKGEEVSGQVIYMNAGVCFFPELLRYLVEAVGYREDEVAFLEGQNAYIGGSKADREEIKELFNEGKVKVLIGSASIKEGIDLQRKGTVLYICKLDWNPTDLKQVEGRIWRFGNEYQHVRIVIPLIEDSVDAFMFQKLEEKTSRINDIWNRAGTGNVLKLEEINPEEIKYGLITDIVARAQLQIEDQVKQAEGEVVMLGDRLQIVQRTIEAGTTFRRLKPVLEKLLTELPKLDDRRQQVKRLAEQQSEATRTYGWGTTQVHEARMTHERAISELRMSASAVVADALDHTEPATEIGLGDWQGFNRQANALIKTWLDYLDYPRISRLNEMWDSFKRKTQELVKAERNVLAPYGLTLNADYTSLLNKLKDETEAQRRKIAEVRSPEFIQNLITELQAERERRSLQSKTVEQRVEEFERLNYLLSIKNLTPQGKIIQIERAAALAPKQPAASAAAAQLKLRLRLRMRMAA